MCGIAGVISMDPAARDPGLVREMLGSLAHRGPDDEGLVEAIGAAIGARRLAIIDLARGHQPMHNEDGTVIAVQNGEIYNFLELRQELRARGHRFLTENDTEVLPHLYEEHGPSFVERLRGMFALAVWDETRRRLVLARDRFGKKPLVYSVSEGFLAFSSEIQGLLVHPRISRDVDPIAIDQYLTFGYVPAPRTGFAAISKVEPAHMVVYEDGQTESRRYWKLRFSPKSRISFDEAAEELRDRIDEAVRIRLMSDVPIGAFLSGGLDSSTVVAFMAKHSSQPVRTFSIGFRDRAYDELAFARSVATAFGTDHTELVVDADDAGVLPLLVRHLGEPFADSSIVPTYHVSRVTRTQVTVALTGDGGDELFAGYDRYKAAALSRLTTDRLPSAVVSAVAAAAGRLTERTWIPRPARRARRFMAALGMPPESRFIKWTGYFTGSLHELIAGERLAAIRSDAGLRLLEHASELSGAVDSSERYMASDLLLNLPGDLLVKMDIASMASSLETRSPLLDHELAEFVATLPAAFKISPRTSKILLRHAMRDLLPEQILRRGKMGFSAPIGAWLRGPLRQLFDDVVLSPTAASRGYVSPAGVRALVDEHMSGRADRTQWLWSLLMLELWFLEVVEPATPRSGSLAFAPR